MRVIRSGTTWPEKCRILNIDNRNRKIPQLHRAAAWAEATEFSPIHVDCIIAIVLKILDDKCKMGAEEKSSLMAIYEITKSRKGALFDIDIHQEIEAARLGKSVLVAGRIHQLRKQAEASIEKPVMKAFKVLLRNSLNTL